jgi:hypothetical protein
MFVLWEPMFPGDARSKIPVSLFDDRRVTSFWDPTEISGTWFGERPLGGLEGGIVWDAYYAFGARSHWGAGAPTQLVAAGSNIIGNTDALQRAFVPLLR